MSRIKNRLRVDNNLIKFARLSACLALHPKSASKSTDGDCLDQQKKLAKLHTFNPSPIANDGAARRNLLSSAILLSSQSSKSIRGFIVKTISVVAAVIVENGRVLATQRGYGEFEGGWEFPGGKIEKGETPEGALVREIHEEMNAQIAVNDFLVQIEYDYPTFHLSMGCYLCSLPDKSFELLEHHAAKWLDFEHLDSVEWLPADTIAVNALKKKFIP